MINTTQPDTMTFTQRRERVQQINFWLDKGFKNGVRLTPHDVTALEKERDALAAINGRPQCGQGLTLTPLGADDEVDTSTFAERWAAASRHVARR